jgi:hypothetical protein
MSAAPNNCPPGKLQLRQLIKFPNAAALDWFDGEIANLESNLMASRGVALTEPGPFALMPYRLKARSHIAMTVPRFRVSHTRHDGTSRLPDRWWWPMFGKRDRCEPPEIPLGLRPKAQSQRPLTTLLSPS